MAVLTHSKSSPQTRADDNIWHLESLIMNSNPVICQMNYTCLISEIDTSMQISAEESQRLLKDLLFSLWTKSSCESTVDVLKLLSLIDFYLPFFPLEREHIRQLFRMKLKERQTEILKASNHLLEWDEAVIDFLTSKVIHSGTIPKDLEPFCVPLCWHHSFIHRQELLTSIIAPIILQHALWIHTSWFPKLPIALIIYCP